MLKPTYVLLGGLVALTVNGCHSSPTPNSDAALAPEVARPADAPLTVDAPQRVDAPRPIDADSDAADTPIGAPDLAGDLQPGSDSPATCTAEEDPGDPVAQPARSGQLPPRRWMLGPWHGTLCGWTYGDPTVPCSPGITTAGDQAKDSLAAFARHDLPITAFHFDGNGWAAWQNQQIPANECRPAFDVTVVEALQAAKVKTLLHWWGHCISAGDFDRANQAMGGTLGGFYLDDGAGTLVTTNALNWIAKNLPIDGAFVSKRYPYPESWTPWGPGYGGIPDEWNVVHGHSAYVNDLTHDWEGMAEGIRRVFDSAEILPAPFNEFLGFQSFPNPGEQPPTLEQYYRRLHFGALQVVMDNSPYENLDPWRPEWDPRLLSAYRYYTWLHHELSPYLHSYDREAYESGTPIFRSPDRERFSTKLGEELFVAYVVGEDITALPVQFPPGEWVDYWDSSRTYFGPGEYLIPVGAVPPAPDAKVPTGREPIFIRRGAILPLDVRRDYTGHGTRESEGSLTVVLYPSGKSSFRYFDDDTEKWVTFESNRVGDSLVLTKSRRLGRPQLYRIEGWPTAPRSVARCARTISVNGENGDTTGSLSPAPSEIAVNGATTSAWFYDATEKRLIVKLFD